ncbi:MAG: dCTP deaminase [Bacteroidota bacterium]
MVLSGKQIQAQLGENIKINPFREEQLNPNSYNLRLHHELLVYDRDELDMKSENTARKITISEEGLLMERHKLYLGRTLEFTETKGYVPMLEGRSSIGRLGLFVHITAGFGDVGFAGFWTLEMFCVQPIRIYAGVEICQIFYHSIEGNYEAYQKGQGHSGGKYQNNRGIQPSLLYKDFEQPNHS